MVLNCKITLSVLLSSMLLIFSGNVVSSTENKETSKIIAKSIEKHSPQLGPINIIGESKSLKEVMSMAIARKIPPNTVIEIQHKDDYTIKYMNPKKALMAVQQKDHDQSKPSFAITAYDLDKFTVGQRISDKVFSWLLFQRADINIDPNTGGVRVIVWAQDAL